MPNAIRCSLALTILSLVLALPSTAARAEEPAIVAQLDGFLGSLPAALRRRAVLPFDHPNRKVWTFLPGRRMGVSLREMPPASRARVMEFLGTVLSERGMTKVRGIFTLETILRAQLSASRRARDPSWRDPLGYYVTLFGAPSASRTSGFRIGGHHLSLNLTIRKGGKVTCSPFFFGGSPADVTRGTHKGLSPLRDQEQTARTLVRSFDATQRKKAILAARIPGGIFLGPARTKTDAKPAGINLMAMSESQLAQFWAVVGSYGQMLSKEIQAQTLRPAELSDPHKVWFVWMGSTEPGRDHYYRIWGPTFAIEYWKNGNHIHSVWRDTSEFGG